MSHHDHDKRHAQTHKPASAGLHKDWRTWTVVLLMLAAMAAYVLTNDEADVPGEPAGEEVPAMAE